MQYLICVFIFYYFYSMNSQVIKFKKLKQWTKKAELTNSKISMKRGKSSKITKTGESEEEVHIIDEPKEEKSDNTSASKSNKSTKDSLLLHPDKDNDEFYSDYTIYQDPSIPALEEGEIKIMTYNVASWNASMKKGLMKVIESQDPDIICIQETKLHDGDSPMVNGYKGYFSASIKKKGYSGTAILTKKKPLSFTYKLNNKSNDEGRIVTLEFDDFYIVNTYVPNAGRVLERLNFRLDWDKEMIQYLNSLQEKKNVIWCGDLNVAVRWIDVAAPKTRLRCAGFTKEERGSFEGILSETKMIDSLQILHPKEKEFYTFFSFMDKSRSKGWRLDYFVMSEKMKDSVKKIYRLKDVKCSEFVLFFVFLIN